ncbi:MAG: hypothetical protein JRJ19_12390 [Deltaproteobacteria bacterium]|nr:hypothetical protein [Deltaproteobacteria bacterium]
MSPCPIPISTVPTALRKHVDPKSPPALRMMASRGMVPMGPMDMVTILTCLTFDDDEKIEMAANKSLAELPERIVKGALGKKLHPLVLDHLARALPEDEDHLEAILTNRDTPDETFEYLGDRVSERLLTLITENQVRILRHPPIAKAVLDNPNIIKSEVERLMDFAVRTGMDFRGLDAFEEARQRIFAAPPDPEESKRIQKVVEDSLPEEMLREEDEVEPGSEEAAELEAKRKPLLQRLYTMTPAQKVVLASKGNKTVRTSLIKDRNKIVAVAAIKNPGVSESEVIGIASSRAVCDEVIRIICANREWTRSYAVKKALVENPKTPIAFSMRFLQTIRMVDLKGLAKSKNIPSAVAMAAKKLLDARSGRRR